MKSEQGLLEEMGDRGAFVQELLLSTLTEQLNLENELDELGSEILSESAPHIPNTLKAGSSPAGSELSMHTASEGNSTTSLSQPQLCTQSKESVGAVSSSNGALSKHVEKAVQQQQKAFSADGGGTVNIGGGSHGNVMRMNQGHGISSQVRQNHNTSSLPSGGGPVFNSHSQSSVQMQALAGASLGAGNLHPLPGRPGSGGSRDRDTRLAQKTKLYKQYPTSQATDREPPPH